ncbi:cytochrome P450 [Pleurotus eryngii]|uniref:Cytochrome P450 n=1 Tax=Pleurotus eryngii TaxID=5323 RepID=A0A9P6A183_PLEER|nr:cytochrome P450 [Pleurotus eryngii]
MFTFLARFVTLALYGCFKLFSRQHYLPLPPGPSTHTFAGAQKLLPRIHPWKTYAAWSQKYRSPLVSFRVYNRRTIVLNTREAIHDLLNKRAHMYSDRPKSWMYHVLCGRGNSVFNISASNERHARYRKLIQSGLGARAAKKYWELLEAEVDNLLQGFRRSPQDFEKHIRRNAAAVIMKMAYGYSILDEDDFFIGVAEEAAQISGWALAPGRWMVDYFPILRYIPSWIPGAHFKRQGEAWRVRLQDLSEVPHQWVKGQMASGTYTDSFTSRLLRPDGCTFVDPDEDDIIKWTAGGLYAGATDTTISAMISFVMLMALHQDVQRRAQLEIHEVTKAHNRTDGLPRASDLGELKYLVAVLKEVLRYAPVSNLALPHLVTQDDEYHGYHIPAGTTIVANVWAVTRDSQTYPNPDVFDPERFVAKDGDESTQQPDPRLFCFGFGRRTCPGTQFAETTMLLTMAGILSQFNIWCNKEAGAPQVDFTTAITSCIVPFDINITPRSI